MLCWPAAAAAETGSVTAASGREVAAVAVMAAAGRLAYSLQTLYLMVTAKGVARL